MALEKSNSKKYGNLHMKSEYLTYEVHVHELIHDIDVKMRILYTNYIWIKSLCTNGKTRECAHCILQHDIAAKKIYTTQL